MKKLLLITLLFTFSLNAQEQYGTYNASGAEISSSISLETGKIYLDLEADGTYGLVLTPKERNSFKLFLEESQVKYKEWAVCTWAVNHQRVCGEGQVRSVRERR